LGDSAERYVDVSLQAAACGRHLEMVERLLAAGANVNAAADSDRGIALQAGAGGGYFELVEGPFAAGAYVSAEAGRYSNRSTTLQAAAGGGRAP
jgi:hypothetical protein